MILAARADFQSHTVCRICGPYGMRNPIPDKNLLYCKFGYTLFDTIRETLTIHHLLENLGAEQKFSLLIRPGPGILGILGCEMQTCTYLYKEIVEIKTSIAPS